MSKWRRVDSFIKDYNKGITPKYVDSSGIIVLNQKCIRNNEIDYSLAQYTDDSVTIKDKAFIEEGDILINSTGQGTAGRCVFVKKLPKDKKVVIDSHILRLIGKSYFEAQCLAYSLSSIEKLLQTYVDGSTGQGEFDKVRFFNLLSSIPKDEKNQKHIASVLSTLDDKIELNNRINAELEAMAKTLYDYWFVQFDFPDTNGKPYKSSGGKMVYNEELKREIPEGWDVDKIGRWIASDKSGDWGKEQEEGNHTLKVSCIRGADINGLNGKGNLNPPERYILEKNKPKYLNPYDLIIEISGGSPTQSTGRMAYISQEMLERFDNPLICSNFCKALSLKDEKYIYNFIFLWNMLYDNKIFFGYEGKTSGIKNFLFDSFINSYWSVIPKEDIVLKFYALMKEVEKKKQRLLAENQHLSSLRDWLLPMLMNGQVGFKEEHQKQTQIVSVAAEAKVDYKPSNPKNDKYHKIQSVYVVLWANSLLGVKQGEMATAKDLYLVDRIAGVHTGFTYAQHSWGSFDPAFKQTINNKYFTKRNFPDSPAHYCDTADNGYLLAKIPEDTKEKVKSSIEELHHKIFKKYFGKQKAEMKELYATVLKCIEDAQSTTFAVIRQTMKNWKTPKQNFPDKAIKFSEQLTKEALDTIIREGWYKNVMRNEG